MKKNMHLQKVIAEEMNKFCKLWNSWHDEEGDDFAAWKLYASDNEIIRGIHELIQWSNFTSEGFAEGHYKDFFLHHVCLADNALRVLIEVNIMNSICNISWTLNFNMNSEVWKRSFTWRTHLDSLSLNDHSKLQIFMNYLLSEKHDLNNADILSAITLYKLTAVADTFTVASSFIWTQSATSVTSVKKLTSIDLTTCTVSFRNSIAAVSANSVTSFKKVTSAILTNLLTSSKAAAFTLSQGMTFSMSQISMKWSAVRSASLLSLLSFLIKLLQLLVIVKDEQKEEITHMSDEDETNEQSEVTRLKECIAQLKAELHQHAQHTDEKVSFLTLMRSCLDEIILLQRQDVIWADQFIKSLLEEPVIQTNQSLIQKIMTWRNDYKQAILTHAESCNEVQTAAGRFLLTWACLFTHTDQHQAQLTAWTDAQDLQWVDESEDVWIKYLNSAQSAAEIIIHSVEKKLQHLKHLCRV